MIWEMQLVSGRLKVGVVRLESAPHVEQLVQPEPGKLYRIIDHTWESLGLTPRSGDPDFIGLAAVEPVQS